MIKWINGKVPKDKKILRYHKIWDCPIAVQYNSEIKNQLKWVECTITHSWPEESFVPNLYCIFSKCEHRCFTPEKITHLNDNEIFVFGSNIAGRHGKGAAKLAKDKFSAIYGQGRGLQGQSYAIPTKDENIKTLSLDQIYEEVQNFISDSFNYPDKVFLVTKIGCGLAGYSIEEIAPLFNKVIEDNIQNIILPKEFYLFLQVII